MKDMLGRQEVLSVERALEILFRAVPFVSPAEAETDILNSLHRVVSRDIVSPEDLPGFTRSTMDGYAVHSAGTFGAREGMPAYLNLVGEIPMGEKPAFEIRKGEAAKIATGGMLPKGADAVVMFENTSVADSALIEVLKPVAPAENTIQSGEDCQKGELILRRGRKIRPQDMGALAGLGIPKVHVFERPKVAIIATGNEVVPLRSSVKTGQVRDINSYSLSGLTEVNGGMPLSRGICRDTYEELEKELQEAMADSHLVAITGGSSVGTRDLTAQVLDRAGKPGVLFHGVSMKPGKPTIGAVIDGKPVFGLPGHPAAVIVSFEVFIKPLLRVMTGETPALPQGFRKIVKAKLVKNIPSHAGRQDYVRVFLQEKDGQLWAAPLLGKSGLITTLVKADGTVIIPIEKPGIEKGIEVDVELF